MTSKKIFIMILSGALLWACGKQEAGRPSEDRVPVEIDVADAGSYVVVSRAGKGPMNTWYNTEVFMAYGESTDGTFQGFTEAKKGIVVQGRTSFQPQLFYPGSDKTIFLRGFHPREQVTNIDAELEMPASGKVHYTITGQEDIMISNAVDGSETNTFKGQGSELHYEHLLTQLSFQMIAQTGFPTTMRVKYIRVKNVSVNAVLDLTVQREMSNLDDPDLLKFTDTPTSNLIAYHNESGLQLTGTATAEGSCVMFRPGEDFDIEVEFTTGDKVTVTEISKGGVDISAGKTMRGELYPVTLTFTATGMIPSVTAGWGTPVPIGDDTGWW